MGEESLTLKVAEALQDEVGYGRGRLDTVTRNELGLSIGDIVEIHGRRRDPTVAIVWRARTEDEGKGIVRVDGLIRNNAKVNLGDKVEVILDGGVRRGTHVLKALCLGAKACSFGKGYLFSLAAGGQKGVEKILEKMKSEINRDMKLMGCKNLSELNNSKLIYRK